MLRLHFQSLKPSHVQTCRQSALLNVQITQPPTEIYNQETADFDNNALKETNPPVVFFNFRDLSAAVSTLCTQLR